MTQYTQSTITYFVFKMGWRVSSTQINLLPYIKWLRTYLRWKDLPRLGLVNTYLTPMIRRKIPLFSMRVTWWFQHLILMQYIFHPFVIEQITRLQRLYF